MRPMGIVEQPVQLLGGMTGPVRMRFHLIHYGIECPQLGVQAQFDLVTTTL
jgi:hypothetical protein